MPDPSTGESEEFKIFLTLLQRSLAEDPQRWTKVGQDIKGVSEETTTGVHRLYQLAEQGKLLFPAINVNDSVTKSKFDNLYGCRHSLVDGINRAVDVMPRRQDRRGLRLRRRRQGLGRVAARPGRPRDHHRDRPDLRAPGDRCRATRSRRSRDVIEVGDVFITTTGNKDIITAADMARMKHQAIVGNIGHFDNEIDVAGLEKTPRHHADQHQAAGRRVPVPRRPLDHPAVRGTPAEPGQRGPATRRS